MTVTSSTDIVDPIKTPTKKKKRRRRKSSASETQDRPASKSVSIKFVPRSIGAALKQRSNTLTSENETRVEEGKGSVPVANNFKSPVTTNQKQTSSIAVDKNRTLTPDELKKTSKPLKLSSSLPEKSTLTKGPKLNHPQTDSRATQSTPSIAKAISASHPYSVPSTTTGDNCKGGVKQGKQHPIFLHTGSSASKGIDSDVNAKTPCPSMPLLSSLTSSSSSSSAAIPKENNVTNKSQRLSQDKNDTSRASLSNSAATSGLGASSAVLGSTTNSNALLHRASSSGAVPINVVAPDAVSSSTPGHNEEEAMEVEDSVAQVTITNKTYSFNAHK